MSTSSFYIGLLLDIVYHAVQMGRGVFDVKILVLARPAFRSQYGATVDFFEIAVGEFVALFGRLVVLVVDAQMPLAVFAEAVPFYSITKPYSWSCDSRAGESRFIPSAEKSSRLQTAPPMLRNTY